jgi:hypothetical protein
VPALESMKEIITEGLGWYGVVAILGAYPLLSFGYIASTSLVYQFLNLSGATGVAIDAYVDRNVQPMVLNVVWALVALVALVTSI